MAVYIYFNSLDDVDQVCYLNHLHTPARSGVMQMNDSPCFLLVNSTRCGDERMKANNC